MHKFRAGDIVERTLHSSAYFTVGQRYEVIAVRPSGLLRIRGDNGKDITTDAGFYRHVGASHTVQPATEGENTMNETKVRHNPFDVPAPWAPSQPGIPKAPPPTAAEHRKIADAIDAHDAKLAEEQAAADAAMAERRALGERIQYEIALAEATSQLLAFIRSLLLSEVCVDSSTVFATFRKELQPLASTYGVKIVLIGQKDRATLVRV